MNTYSAEEIEAAKQKVPGPIAEFIDSSACNDAFKNIGAKHALNLREMGAVYELSRATLLGLESEETFTTTLETALPEMAKEKMHSLIADINERVFQKARLRLKSGVGAEPGEDARRSVV
jgi:hypothetical protein